MVSKMAIRITWEIMDNTIKLESYLFCEQSVSFLCCLDTTVLGYEKATVSISELPNFKQLNFSCR